MANLKKARSKNKGADRVALDSFAATRARVETILERHGLFLSWDRRKAIIANIRDGKTSFSWLRDRSDVWQKNHTVKTLDNNRDTPFDNDLAAIRRGYQGIASRIQRIYSTRNLDLTGAQLDTLVRRVMQNKVTLQKVRTTATKLQEQYDSAGAVDDIGEDSEDVAVDPFDLNAAVKGMFPFLSDSLVQAYVEGWEEFGDPAAALAQMRESPAYEQQFPGNKLAPGQFALSEADYIGYQQQARDLMQEYGLPPEYFDTDEDIGRLVKHQVRLSQLEERIRKGYVAALQAPPEVREELSRGFNVGIGDLAAFWLDPTKGEDLLQRKFTEAQIRGAATTSGLGDLSIEDSEELANFGVDEQSARQGFSALVEGRGLFEGLIGSREEDITLQDQLAATFLGDGEQRERLRRRAESRIAAFSGGGGSATTQEGSIGLREAE